MDTRNSALEGNAIRTVVQRLKDSLQVVSREASTWAVLVAAALLLQMVSFVIFRRDMFFGFEYWIAGLAYLRHLSLLGRGERPEVRILVEDACRRGFSKTGLILMAAFLVVPVCLFSVFFFLGPLVALLGTLFAMVFILPIFIFASYVQVGMVHLDEPSMEPMAIAWRVVSQNPVHAIAGPTVLTLGLGMIWLPMRFILLPLGVIPIVGFLIYTAAVSLIQALIMPLLATHAYLVYVDSLAAKSPEPQVDTPEE